jgi:lipoprotein-releasing system permease protein
VTAFAFERLVGWRYTRGGRALDGRDRFISFIGVLAVAGIALGVAALIVVLSVVNGFQREVRDRMLTVIPHIEVLPRLPGTDWRTLAADLRADPRIIGAAPFVTGQVVVARDDRMRGALVRGIDPAVEAEVSDIGREMTAGSLDALQPGARAVVLGAALARVLDVDIGDRINLITPRASERRAEDTAAGPATGVDAGPATLLEAGPAARADAGPRAGSDAGPTLGSGPAMSTLVPNVGRYAVVGVFESGHHDYDSTLILMAAEDAHGYFGNRALSGLRLRVSDPDEAPVIASDLARRLGRGVAIRDWSAENRIWFASVQVQKRMLALILALIIGVAAFNLVAMLVMVVTDKRPDIAILRTLGATPQSILSIFMIQGAIIGCIGTVVGTGLGIALALNLGRLVGWIEGLAGFRVIDPAVYLLSDLPSEVRPAEVIAIAAASLALALVATIYPSLRAARVRPAQALRHE